MRGGRAWWRAGLVAVAVAALAACSDPPMSVCGPAYNRYVLPWPQFMAPTGLLDREQVQVNTVACGITGPSYPTRVTARSVSPGCSPLSLERDPVITVSDELGQPVAGTSVAAGVGEIHFQPAEPFQPGVLYTATASGGLTRCGQAVGTTWTFTPWRPAGLDPAFGEAGEQVLPDLVPRSMTLLPEGGTLLGGYASAASSCAGCAPGTPLLARLDGAGKPDATRWPGGLAICPQPWLWPAVCDGGAGITAVAADGAGRILGLGAVPFRLDPGGALDPTFGTGGALFVAGVDAVPVAPIRLQPDGRILILRSPVTYPQGQIIRVDDLGVVDPTFGTSGAIRDLTDPVDLQPLPDGGLLVLRRGSGGSAVHRFDRAGNVDRAFGNTGVASAGDGLLPRSLRVDGLGRILVVGVVADYPLTFGSMAVVRLGPDGALDASFADGGTYRSSAWSKTAAHLAVTADGRSAFAGDYADGEGITLLDAAGQLVRKLPWSVSVDFLPEEPLAFDQAGRLVVAASLPWAGPNLTTPKLAGYAVVYRFE